MSPVISLKNSIAVLNDTDPKVASHEDYGGAILKVLAHVLPLSASSRLDICQLSYLKDDDKCVDDSITFNESFSWIEPIMEAFPGTRL